MLFTFSATKPSYHLDSTPIGYSCLACVAPIEQPGNLTKVIQRSPINSTIVTMATRSNSKTPPKKKAAKPTKTGAKTKKPVAIAGANLSGAQPATVSKPKAKTSAKTSKTASEKKVTPTQSTKETKAAKVNSAKVDKPVSQQSTGKGYWLVKSEPFKFSFAQLIENKMAVWDGVRNFEARNNLRAMNKGDLVLFYHSNEGKEIVGLAKVSKAAYPDPTAGDGDWSAVDIVPVGSLKRFVSLDEIRTAQGLETMVLLKKNRLSVTPVSASEFDVIMKLGKSKLSAKGGVVAE